MTLRVRTLIAATALATLSGACAYAAPVEGTWNQGAFPNGGGSQIVNSQVTLKSSWSNLNGDIDGVAGDAVVQGAGAGNLMDITTMNSTAVNNSQIVGSSATIGADVKAGVKNVGGSVGIQGQAVCNGVNVSTDPTSSATRSYQECGAQDPAATVNAWVSNAGGDAVIQGSALGNSLEADSNAPNMSVMNAQINSSSLTSTVNANVRNIGGSTSVTSSAIGNSGQIVQYNAN
jgi:hypothetical protein